MLSTVTEHYAAHLAPIYSWMVGDFSTACDTAAQFFDSIELQPSSSRLAVDLGCGHGVQTIPLAQGGFRVVAIDNSDTLLTELSQNVSAATEALDVTIVNDDLLNMEAHVRDDVDVIICMGDTLTHLPSLNAVRQLIDHASNRLTPGGTLLLSFRDYWSQELKGTDRFIPVRSDEQRIHTCFLDYQPDTVHVHDIVHTRTDSGWQTTVSAYPKLRLAPDSVVSYADAKGFTVSHQSTQRGMLYLALHR